MGMGYPLPFGQKQLKLAKPVSGPLVHSHQMVLSS